MSESPSAQKILIIKLGALGDIIRSLDAIHSVRKSFPHSQIDLLTRKQHVAFCETIPWFDKVRPAATPRLWELGKWLDFTRMLRLQKYDLVVDLQCKSRTTLYHLLTGVNGPRWSGTSPWSTYPRPQPDRANIPAHEHQRMQLESIPIPWAGPAELDWLAAPLDDLVLPPRSVILAPGCSPQHPGKRWPAASYAALSHHLEKKGIASVVIGTSAEQSAIDEFTALAPHAVNLVNKTTIHQLASLARRAASVVSNDTGPAHVTAAVGAPTLVLMSHVTDPECMLPIGTDVSYIKKHDISDISVEEVLQALRLRDTP
jgi:ADP-heptose:LPS heptosyltransferase